MKYVSVTTLLAGLVLMVLSFYYPQLVHEQLVKKNTAEVVRAHEAMGVMHSSTSTPEDRERARFERHHAQDIVDARIQHRDFIVVALRVAGVLLAVVGVTAYFRMQSRLAE